MILGTSAKRLCVISGLARLRLSGRKPETLLRLNSTLLTLLRRMAAFRQALNLMHRAHDLYVVEQLPLEAAAVRRGMVECYLFLNRFAEARALAKQVAAEFRSCGAAYEEAISLLHLATAEAELDGFPAAHLALDTAESLFVSLGAAAWVATIRMRRGRIALQQRSPDIARREALEAATYFKTSGQLVDYAMASLVEGQAALLLGHVSAANDAGVAAIGIAQRCNVPALRYSAHLLLGHVAEAQGDIARARHRYRAANAGDGAARAQQRLTITLRPGFLEDKGEALRALIALHLRCGVCGLCP